MLLRYCVGMTNTEPEPTTPMEPTHAPDGRNPSEEEVTLVPDSRNRVTLGALMRHNRYRAALGEHGVITLTPIVELTTEEYQKLLDAAPHVSAAIDAFLADPSTGVRREWPPAVVPEPNRSGVRDPSNPGMPTTPDQVPAYLAANSQGTPSPADRERLERESSRGTATNPGAERHDPLLRQTREQTS